MSEIKRAIFRLEQSKRLSEPTYFTPEEYNTTLQALQSELDRQENKPLTVSELKEMVGEPVYLVIEPYHTKEISKIHKNQYVIIVKDELNNIYAKGVTGKFDLGSFEYYKHKPTEGAGR